MEVMDFQIIGIVYATQCSRACRMYRGLLKTFYSACSGRQASLVIKGPMGYHTSPRIA